MTKLLEDMPSVTTFDTAKAPTFSWIRWLQSLVDVLNRPISNRVSASTNATAIACNGAAQSTGIGTGAITPGRYAELWVNARATFNLNFAGSLFVYVYRTLGNVPANGSAPNVGDVVVGGDAFAGSADVANQNFAGSLSFIDSGLDSAKAYKYYFAVNGTNTKTANLVNSSQIQVSEF